MENYRCTVCNRTGVKLWRPYGDSEPLICASCAEKRQVSMTYKETTWVKEGTTYIGTPTGKELELPKWTVDEFGEVPSYKGPPPVGASTRKTDQLIVDLKDVSECYQSGNTTMIPAVPYDNEKDSFYTYLSVPEKLVKWWVSLPTH